MRKAALDVKAARRPQPIYRGQIPPPAGASKRRRHARRASAQFVVNHAAISCSRATTTTSRWPQIAALDRPAFVPRTTGRRQEMTATPEVSNPEVRNQIRPSPQVARSAAGTLSRVETRVRTPLRLRGATAGHRSNSDSDKPDASGLGGQIPRDPAPRCTSQRPERTTSRERTVHQRPSFVPVTICFASPRLLYL